MTMTPHDDQSFASLLQGPSSIDWNTVKNELSGSAPPTAFLASILPLNPPLDFVDWFLDAHPDQISEYAQRKSPLESCFSVSNQQVLRLIARATARYNERGVWFKSHESIFRQLLPESHIRILLEELPCMMRPLILSYLMGDDNEEWGNEAWGNLKLVLEWLTEQNDNHEHDLVHSENDDKALYGHIYLATLLPSLDRWRDSVDSIVSCLVFIQRHHDDLLVAQNKQGWTLLHFLLVQLHPDRLFRDQVKFSTRCLDPLLDLLTSEQACWTSTKDGDLPLHVALENNVSFVIPRLVQAAPLTLEIKGSQGMFPFQLACLHLTADDDDEDDDKDDTFVVTQLYTLLRQAPHLVLFNNMCNNKSSFFVDSDMALQVAKQDMELARLSRRRRAHEAHQRQVNLQMRRNMNELLAKANRFEIDGLT